MTAMEIAKQLNRVNKNKLNWLKELSRELNSLMTLDDNENKYIYNATKVIRDYIKYLESK